MGAVDYSKVWNHESAKSSFNQLLALAVHRGAIDIYLQSGSFPTIRKKGSIEVLTEEYGLINDDKIRCWTNDILDANQLMQLEQDQALDFSYELPKQGRFRANISKSYGQFVFSIRIIGHAPLKFESLNLPKILKELCKLERGLILVTGKAGSGKSTTLASMVHHISRNQPRHVVTIEDPIEYRHQNGVGFVTQKEIGNDVESFNAGLKSALRQNPDVITLGELRDAETIKSALVAAETGHLVMSTLHTTDAPGTISRILSSYGPKEQQQVRAQLASTLQAVVSQRLMPSADGTTMVPAVEVMIVNDRIRQMIRHGDRVHEIYQAIEEGYSTYGMQTFDQSLLQLYTKGVISIDMAVQNASRPADFELRCSGVKAEDSAKWEGFDKDQQGSADRYEIVIEEKNRETWERPTHAVRVEKPRRKRTRKSSSLFDWFF